VEKKKKKEGGTLGRGGRWRGTPGKDAKDRTLSRGGRRKKREKKDAKQKEKTNCELGRRSQSPQGDTEEEGRENLRLARESCVAGNRRYAIYSRDWKTLRYISKRYKRVISSVSL